MVDTLTLPLVNAPPPVVTKAEFARLIDVTRQAVSKMVRDKRLSGPAVTEDGRIVVAEALRQLGRSVATPTIPASDPPDGDPGPGEDTLYADARARREAANAELAELSAARVRGDLIDRAGADRAYRDQVRRLRDRLLQVPAEVAAPCVLLTDEIAIESAIRQALEAALQDAANAADDPDADQDPDDTVDD